MVVQALLRLQMLALISDLAPLPLKVAHSVVLAAAPILVIKPLPSLVM